LASIQSGVERLLKYSEGGLPRDFGQSFAQSFGHSLNQPCHNLLNRLTYENPDLEYKTFWAILDKEYGRDATYMHREAWVQVPLIIKGRYLTLEELRAFESEFMSRALLVHNKREGEVCELPHHWRLKLLIQQSMFAANQHWAGSLTPPTWDHRMY